ncbi:hypothetical protein [Paenibacillus tarimensis]|uniref:hypothetical protein n=1 Tax=Paenibacillus tarimensis TaxID=416012 RepID=UPI001F3B5BC9|nr:hypothetical protein [Paenibacillus tarimensis]MCF2945163.1 hypothetical protein [Paenibacillus tarimensis]
MRNLFKELEHAYHITRRPVPVDFRHQAFFKKEPCEYTYELYAQQSDKNGQPPEYIINCYDTYPSSKKSTALLNKKALGLKDATVFSLCDQGSACPILAVKLACLKKCKTVVICMEEIYSISECWGNESYYPKCEAAALFQVSPEEGEWKVAGLRRQWCDKGVEDVRNLALLLIKDTLDEAGVSPNQTLIIPQRLNALYEEYIQSYFPHSYTHNGRENYQTADPFYSLEQAYTHNVTKKWKYILLNFADHKTVGCLLLSAAKAESI